MKLCMRMHDFCMLFQEFKEYYLLSKNIIISIKYSLCNNETNNCSYILYFTYKYNSLLAQQSGLHSQRGSVMPIILEYNAQAYQQAKCLLEVGICL